MKYVEIPVGFTLNFLYAYPEPEFRTLTSLRFFLLRVLNLWIPLADVAVDNPIVLIPTPSFRASDSLRWSLTVVVLTTLTTYSSPLIKVPVIPLLMS